MLEARWFHQKESFAGDKQGSQGVYITSNKWIQMVDSHREFRECKCWIDYLAIIPKSTNHRLEYCQDMSRSSRQPWNLNKLNHQKPPTIQIQFRCNQQERYEDIDDVMQDD